MTVFVPGLPPPPVLTPNSIESVAGLMVALPNITIASSASYPAANRAHYFPIHLPWPYEIRKFFVVNGATLGASANVDLGIYDRGGRRIVSTGSTARSGTEVLQVIDVADTLVGPGQFYLAIASDVSTSNAFYRSTYTQAIARGISSYQEASAFPLPATATFAQIASGLAIIVGITNRTVI